MKKKILWVLCAFLGSYGILLAAGQDPSPLLRNYKQVTAERLLKPEDGNWLMIRRTYDGWGYSPLDQITPANVARLKPVWMSRPARPASMRRAPLVNNGVMFVSTPNNQVIALDAKTGNVLWRYQRPRPTGAFVPHDTNRGVALYGDKVYFAAGEAVLVALDAKTGRKSGRRRSPTTSRATTSRWRRWSPTARSWSARPAASSASAASSRRSIPKPARSCGAPTRFPRPANRAARRGRRATSGRPAARRSG